MLRYERFKYLHAQGIKVKNYPQIESDLLPESSIGQDCLNIKGGFPVMAETTRKLAASTR